jgi:hypothetical protein
VQAFQNGSPLRSVRTIQPSLENARARTLPGGDWHGAWDHASFTLPARLTIDPTMPSLEKGNHTRTDIIVAIILAAIAVLWILAYIVIFVKSGAA